MKTKQPNPANYFDYVSIYETNGTRDATGGFTESQSLVGSIWANVSQRTIPANGSSEGRRQFTKSIKIRCYAGAINTSNLIQFNAQMYFVYNIDNSNPAEDIVYAELIQ